MSDPATAPTTHEAETTATSNTLPSAKDDVESKDAGGEPVPDSSNEMQEDHPAVATTPTGTETVEPLDMGRVAEGPLTLPAGDGTGAKEGVKTPQTTTEAPSEAPSAVEGATFSSPTATKDRVDSTSGPPTNSLARNPAVGPSAKPVIDKAARNEALISAAEDGSEEDVRKLLLEGAEILSTNDDGETALHLAARHNNLDVVKAVLEQYKKQPFDANIKDDDGWTPLYGSAAFGSIELVKILLEMKGDLRVQIPSGQTPLYRACYWGNADVAKLILDIPVGGDTIEVVNNEGLTPLHIASSEGEVDTVKILLDHGAKADRRDFTGRTPLHLAADRDEVVSILFEKLNALIDLTDSESQTALHLAAKDNNLKVVQFLINKGAKVELTDSDGRNALHLACRYDADNDVVEFLAGRTKNIIDSLDNDGYTALDWAFKRGTDSSIEILLEQGASPNINNNDSEWSILRQASSIGNVSVVESLLEHGAIINYAGKDDWTALHQACDDGEDQVVKILLEKKADTKRKTEDTGEIPLHLAARRGHEEVIKLLLDPGLNLDIDVAATTAKDETALHLAAGIGSDHVVELLLHAGSSVTTTTENNETALQLAGRGNEEGHKKSIKILSHAMDPLTRKGTLLGLYGLEDQATLDRLCENLDWNGLSEPEVKEEGGLILDASQKEKHNDVLGKLKAKAAKKVEIDKLPDPYQADNLTALQWAAYLGDYVIVSWLMWSGWRKELKEIQEDRNHALKIAKYCVDLLASKEVRETGATAETVQRTNIRRGSKEEATVNSRKTITHATNALNVPEPISEEIFLPEKVQEQGPNRTEMQELAFSLESALLARRKAEQENPKKAEQGKPKKSEQEKISKVDQEKNKELKRKKDDYSRTIDTLLDPPVRDYTLVRGWSETDDLSQKPPFDKVSQHLAEQFDATIVDFYRQKEDGDARVDFLRRTRSVWDVVYAGDVVYEEKTKTNPTEKDTKTDLPGGNEKNAIPSGKFLDETNIYGPGKIMEDARKKVRETGSNSKVAKQKVYTEDALQFRWLHLPANNLEWMMDLTKRVFREKKKTQEMFRPLAEFIRQSFHELPGTKPYMRSSCTKEHMPLEKIPAMSGLENGSQESPEAAFGSSTGDHPNNELPSGKGDSRGPPRSPETKKPGIPEYWRLALYMPYISFATYSKPGLKPKDKNNDLSDAYPPKSVRDNVDENGSKSDPRNDWKILHESRTLDQFYYHSLKNTEDRDADQVVTRYVNNLDWTPPYDRSKQWDILRVDQLWLWVIDEKTIITSSTNRLDEKADPVLEDIFNYLKEAKGKRKGQPPPSSVDEMSKFISTFCIDLIDKSTLKCDKDELSARQIFANSINNAANKETKLFDTFNCKIAAKLATLKKEREAKKARNWSTLARSNSLEENEQEKDYGSISTATRLLLDVKDMRDELNILSYLLTQQKTVWEKLLGLSVNEDGSIIWNDAFLRETEKWKGPGYALKDVIEMDKIAQRIQDSVNSVLGLEQNEANISEAETTRKQTEETIEQGRTLMVFTIITIVFLPMSFLASLFALNITSFPHTNDNLLYEPKFIFSIIFGVTTIIALPTIGFARYKHPLQRVFSRLWVAIKHKVQPLLPKKLPPSTPPGDPLAKQKPENKPEPRPLPEKEHPPVRPQIANGPGSDNPSLQKEAKSNGKEIFPSGSHKTGEQQLETGESEEQHGSSEGIWKFFKHPFGTHPPSASLRTDVEQGLKR